MTLKDIWNKIVNPPVVETTENTSEDVGNAVARFEYTESEHLNNIIKATEQKYIVCNGTKVPINWKKVVLWTDKDGMGYDKKCYKPQKSRKPTMFVVHWDACLSTKSMVNVTKERGLSVHFGIDNDGTIYQLLDTKDIAWHARGVNSVSVGVEISNAVVLNFNESYKKVGLPYREVTKKDTIHGKQCGPYLNFYPEQIEALKALTKALNKAHDIPLQTPLDKDGNPLRGVCDEVVKNTYKGVIGHYHVTTAKIDPGNLPLKEIMKELNNKD